MTMSEEGPAPVDSKCIRAVGHRTRVGILEYLEVHTVASAPELSRALGIAENWIDHHLSVLRECDYVEHAVARRRSGKDTQFYGLKSGLGYLTRHSGSLLEGEPVSRDTLDAFVCKVHSAFEADAADESADPTLTVEALALTEPFRRVALEALRRTVFNLRLLHEQSRQLNIATDEPLISVELGIAMVPATPPVSEDRPSDE